MNEIGRQRKLEWQWHPGPILRKVWDACIVPVLLLWGVFGCAVAWCAPPESMARWTMVRWILVFIASIPALMVLFYTWGYTWGKWFIDHPPIRIRHYYPDLREVYKDEHRT